MTIDVTLLHPPEKGGNLEEVRKWQCARIVSSISSGTEDHCTHNDVVKDSNPTSSSSSLGCSSTTRADWCFDVEFNKWTNEYRELEKKKATLWKHANAKRSEVKSLQTQLKLLSTSSRNKDKDNMMTENDGVDDNKNMDMETIRETIRQLKTVLIPQLSNELENCQNYIEQNMIPMLANVVVVSESDNSKNNDDDINIMMKEESTFLDSSSSNTNKHHLHLSFTDPLFCLEGYERIQIPRLGSNNTVRTTEEIQMKEYAILKGFGSELAAALSLYTRRYFQNQMYEDTNTSTNNNAIRNMTLSSGQNNKYQECHLPPTIPMELHRAHQIMGCSTLLRNECPISNYCSESKHHQQSTTQTTPPSESSSIQKLFPAPSYVAQCLCHQNKSYPDKDLPKTFICTTSITHEEQMEQDTILSLSPQSPKTMHTKQQQQQQQRDSVYNLMHPTERIDVFIMATSNLTLSMNLQDEFAQRILQFYQSLLTTINNSPHYTTTTTNTNTSVRIRSITPSELQMNEARRIVIEGYLPYSQTYVQLAYISNTTDYISRSFKIRCGGSNDKPSSTKSSSSSSLVEYSHILQGTLCHVNVNTIQWILENNITFYKSSHPSIKEETIVTTNDEKKKRNKKNKRAASSKTSNGGDEEVGVMLPYSIVSLMKSTKLESLPEEQKQENKLHLFFPFQQSLQRGKGGKLIVEQLNPTESLRFVLSSPSPQKDTSHDHEIDEDTTTTTTGKDITGEAICNPYSFLPL